MTIDPGAFTPNRHTDHGDDAAVAVRAILKRWQQDRVLDTAAEVRRKPTLDDLMADHVSSDPRTST